MVKITCNLCKYNLTVTQALEPWACEVMLGHAKRLHPQALEAAVEKALQEQKEETPCETSSEASS